MNYSRFQAFWTCAALALAFMAATPAVSEKLSQKWQRDRDYYGIVTDLACEGEQDAYRELKKAAIERENSVAQNNMVWINGEDDCLIDGRDMEYAYALQYAAADAGYPIAINNYGHRLMKGVGIAQSAERAIRYFDRAITLGYGTAALDLAEYYLEGKYIARSHSKAAQLLHRARVDDGPEGQYPDKELIAALARRMDNMSASEVGLSPSTQQLRWTTNEGTALKWHVSNGRRKAAAFVGTNNLTGQLVFGFSRYSNDPVIHFMGVSVEFSDGSEQELHFGKCGANNCLTAYFDYMISPSTFVEIPIIPSQREITLNALKSGAEITFRYQTQDSLEDNNFTNYTFNLKGSRKAIEQVERMSSVIANEYNRPAVDYSNSDASTADAPDPVATTEPIVMSYDSAAIIDSAARSAGGKFSAAPVTCFYAGTGASPAGIHRELNLADERYKQVNAAVIAEPLGKLVLQYIWGGVVLEHLYSNSTAERYVIIEQRDHYTGTNACVAGDFEYATPEAALTGMIEYANSQESRTFSKREVPNWRQRIIRPGQ